ncbi:LysR family transcriptional regulator [Vibrio sp. MACH09]|uniref:LysR family transcriptional regulator n=1 Tax=unclassified Vibrio TaxID=2614977 RepID=UPI001493731F|nr:MULTISPECIES: LysR family transcriptional regulator [unclassified Vibrio]NOI65790.1 LysR family transcriptional regulator [Vibrio sp. 99-8-1]GLO62733.1 LysR family transcriptional regulator [Vibrio sp. MACH09]
MYKASNFDLKLLKIFAQIVESGGFSAAQSKLNMHQSSISQKMHDLEQRLNMKLCQRGRGGFKLTNDGYKVYEACKALFVDIEKFEHVIDDIRSVTLGHVRLAMTDNIATNPECNVYHAIQKFCKKYPNVSFDTDIMDSQQIEEQLISGKVDIGITSSEIMRSCLNYHFLFSEKQRLYCTPDHDILALGEITSRKDIAPYAVVERGLAHKVTPLSHKDDVMHMASCINMEATAQLILSGQFIGYLPTHYAETWLNQKRLVALDAPKLDYLADFHLTIAKQEDELSVAPLNFYRELRAAHSKECR